MNVLYNIGWQNNNKIIKIKMNLLPSIQKPRKGFKFSNPLSGIIYNNNYYLQQCQYNPDPEHQHEQVSILQGNKKRNSLNTTQTQTRTRTKYWTKLSDSKINYSLLQGNQLLRQSSSKVEHQVHKQPKGYKFPDIEIKIIDEIQSSKDFHQKNLRINLTHYYNMFFKKQLAGTMTLEFIEIIQKYLQILISKGKLDMPVEIKDYPSEYFSIKSKRALVEKIQELQAKKSFRPIQEIIKYYCIPTKEFRESCFRDILHMIAISLYEKFNLSKEKDYVLLDQNGRLIQDICGLKFSTTNLLITTRPHHQRSYNQYRSIIQSNLQNFKKISFSDQLKKNFRNSIAAGKFDQLVTNENKSHIESSIKKRGTDSRLQHSKSPQRKSPEKPISPQKYSPSKTTNSFNIPLSKSRQKLPKHRVSKSSLASPTAHSASKLGAQTAVKMRSLSARKRIQQYRQTFQKLRVINNIYDITFNHNNQERLLVKMFRKQFQHLKNKTELQVSKILKAFRIESQAQSITYQDYQRMCEVINCKGETAHIIDFVTRYLEFNQYGELDKNGLNSVVSSVLNDINGQEIVVQIIWSWFQKNGLIDNNVLVKNTLQSWYEKNKMAFVIVVSLVFGNNRASWIDMAYEVLV